MSFLINAINAAANNFAKNPTFEVSTKVLDILNADYFVHYLQYIKGNNEKKSQVWELEEALRAMGRKEADLNVIRSSAIEEKRKQDDAEMSEILDSVTKGGRND